MSVEARAWPLWVLGPEGVGVDEVDPASPELGLSVELARDLLAWQSDFDALFDWDDPGSAEFSAPEAEREFAERGWELARRVRRELDENWEVTYHNGPPYGEVVIRKTSAPGET
ncbi:hypothetical protein [Amycolatopsis sp. NPDC051903]|uniref:hypothetical protein n=1 Tax=Amycolatopsis sp. NPDC051903 TaxID=3363936 RepID=UPI00378D7ABF